MFLTTDTLSRIWSASGTTLTSSCSGDGSRCLLCSALLALGLVPRTTRDVDVLAFWHDGNLSDAEPFPDYLVLAARQVGRILALPDDWLNSGPAAQFRMGLPEGFVSRLIRVRVGDLLTIHYVSRQDQIFFKVYAAADRGGYHVSDLRSLAPTSEELIAAARWCMTQDVSVPFREILQSMFLQLGWKDVSERI